MALPVAHLSIALGAGGSKDWKSILILGLLSVAPDFDFALVWGLGLPVDSYHRTFSHSLTAALLIAVAYALVRPAWLRLSPWLVLAVYASHSLLDLLCTADIADHGVMIFWPFSLERFGGPILVPLYRNFAESPFSLAGATLFTVLELMLAPMLWAAAWLVRRALLYGLPSPASVSGSSSSQSSAGRGRSTGAISSRLSPS